MLATLYWPVATGLVRQWWSDDNYSHGFVVPLFSALLVWQRRHRLLAIRPSGSWLGLPVLLASAGALVLGDIGAEQFLTRISLVGVLAGLVLFHLGREAFRLLAFPLLFLFAMVPLPATLFYAIAFPLQTFAAQNAAWVLGLLGVPVLLEGNVIHLSHISLGVTEACSGIRSLISLLSVGLAWGYLTLPGAWGTIGLTVAALPITVLANAGRIVLTGLIARWLGVEYAQGVFHSLSGWAIFLVALACLLAVHTAMHLILRRRIAPA